MSREVKLSVKSALDAMARGIKSGQRLVQVAQSGIEAVKKIGQETKHSKAELRALRAEQDSAEKQQAALQRESEQAAREERAAAKRARAKARAIANRTYRDSRINTQGIYSTVGNLREKVPTLFRSLSDPAHGFSTLVSVFGEGIAGVVAAAPFMAAAGGILAMIKPVLEERDKISKELVLAEVRGMLAEFEETFAEQFLASRQFQQTYTNLAIQAFTERNADAAKGGWINERDVEIAGF